MFKKKKNYKTKKLTQFLQSYFKEKTGKIYIKMQQRLVFNFFHPFWEKIKYLTKKPHPNLWNLEIIKKFIMLFIA